MPNAKAGAFCLPNRHQANKQMCEYSSFCSFLICKQTILFSIWFILLYNKNERERERDREWQCVVELDDMHVLDIWSNKNCVQLLSAPVIRPYAKCVWFYTRNVYYWPMYRHLICIILFSFQFLSVSPFSCPRRASVDLINQGERPKKKTERTENTTKAKYTLTTDRQFEFFFRCANVHCCCFCVQKCHNAKNWTDPKPNRN